MTPEDAALQRAAIQARRDGRHAEAAHYEYMLDGRTLEQRLVGAKEHLVRLVAEHGYDCCGLYDLCDEAIAEARGGEAAGQRVGLQNPLSEGSIPSRPVVRRS